MTDLDEDLLIRAKSAYQEAITDPTTLRVQAPELVREARQRGNTEALCLMLRAWGWAERYAMEHRRALRLLNTATRIARESGFDHLLGEVLVTRGAIQHESGRLSAARRDFDAAEPLLPHDAIAELTIQRATLAANLGDLASAAHLYAQLLRDATLELQVRTKAAANFGILQAHRGRFTEALALFDEAERAAEQVSPVYAAIVAENRAWVTALSGRLAEGVTQLEAAKAMFDKLDLPAGELLMEYSDALTQLRLLPEALEHARQAIGVLEGPGAELMAAEARLNLAWLALQSNRLDEAVAEAEQARTSFRRQRRGWGAARATSVELEASLRRGTIESRDVPRARKAAQALERASMRTYAVTAYLVAGRVAAKFGRQNLAKKSWTRSYEFSRSLPLLNRLVGTHAAALAAWDQGQTGRVRSLTRSGLDDLAKHRAALPSIELRALASGHGEEIGRLGLASRIGSQPAARVLEWMERSRAAALSVVEPEPSADIEDDIGELRAAYAELVAARQENGTEPAGLRARQRRIEQRIRRATWSTETSGQPGNALSAPELRRALDGRILVELDVLDGELVAAILEPRRTRIVNLGPLDRVLDQAERLLFYLRYLARPRAEGQTAATMLANADEVIGRLTATLVEPLNVADDAELVIIPVRGLHSLPWTALHSGPVALAPSGSMWAQSRAASQVRPSGQVVLAAGPELAGAHDEIEELAALYDDAVVIAPPESTMAAVTAAMDGASLAHLACHCYIRADNPTFSRLLLSDGFLTVHELHQRAYVPHRVVLAACESGRDASYDGNEMLGFVSTLMAKGAAGVLASSVVVPDKDLVPLLREFHRAVAEGSSFAHALHTARAGIDRSDPKQFVAWCAFNSFGAA
ncbi:MAG TPA: CHAT domain-containing tetratricopeptide repeat protein [Jiangellaceae bacterium]